MAAALKKGRGVNEKRCKSEDGKERKGRKEKMEKMKRECI